MEAPKASITPYGKRRNHHPRHGEAGSRSNPAGAIPQAQAVDAVRALVGGYYS